MQWFRKAKTGIATISKKETPGDLWLKCDGCKEVLYRKELVKNNHVCEYCQHHFRIGAWDYIKILADAGTFEESDATVRSSDPLKFAAKKRYKDSLIDAEKKSGLTSAVVSGIGKIAGLKVSIGAMDFRFVGGSLGSAEGEKLARVIRRARHQGLPAIIICASGGARMQEGALSLMQMAKISAEIAHLSKARLPYIALLTDPTLGGVSASYAMLGDVILAEPGALIGFAGPRVIRETIRQELPPGFQKAEFLLEKGFLDMIVPRGELKTVMSSLLTHLHPSASRA